MGCLCSCGYPPERNPEHAVAQGIEQGWERRRPGRPRAAPVGWASATWARSAKRGGGLKSTLRMRIAPPASERAQERVQVGHVQRADAGTRRVVRLAVVEPVVAVAHAAERRV